MNAPLVSICIPTYNGGKYLNEALLSVKDQTYPNIEVVISDDQSTDDTKDICKNFKDDVNFNVKIVEHIPAGIGANWNNCIINSSGEYIKFLFQDDILNSYCVEVMMDYITTKNLFAVCSKREIIDENGTLVTSGEWYSGCKDLQKSFLNLEFKDFHILQKSDLKGIKPWHLSANIFGEPIAFLFKKEIFSKVGLFSTEYKQILDTELAYRILEKHTVGLIEKQLFKFRLHSEQATAKNRRDEKSSADEIRKFELYLIRNFYKHLSVSTVKYNLRKHYQSFDLAYKYYERFKNIIKR